jgi:hypothetical protein
MAFDLIGPDRAHYQPGFRKDQYMESFYRGLLQAYQLLQEKKVDAVLLPFRGAEVIGKGLTLMYELDRKEKPEFIYLNIGELDKKGQRKMSEAAIRGEIARRICASRVVQMESPVLALVDEALSGGSISLNLDRMQKFLEEEKPDAKLFGIAIKQREIKRPLAPRYEERVMTGDIIPIEVKHLFFTDNESILHSLMLNGSGKPHIGPGGDTFKRLDVLTDLQMRHRGIRERKNFERV